MVGFDASKESLTDYIRRVGIEAVAAMNGLSAALWRLRNDDVVRQICQVRPDLTADEINASLAPLCESTYSSYGDWLDECWRRAIRGKPMPWEVDGG